jgi:hypothetical protein
MRNYSHFGTRFEVWNRQQSWFWVVVDPRGNRGSIGAAISEAEAIGEASASIEENCPRSCKAVFAWKTALANLAQYLAGSDHAGFECAV